MVLALFFPIPSQEVGEEWVWAGWAEMPRVRGGLPSLELASARNQTSAGVLGELLLCTHVRGHFQHNPPISHSTQKPLTCIK